METTGSCVRSSSLGNENGGVGRKERVMEVARRKAGTVCLGSQTSEILWTGDG